jgi:dolichyl-phosphate-mannose--protein O-mannosyl transferase
VEVEVIADEQVADEAAGQPAHEVPPVVRRRLESMPGWNWKAWGAALWVFTIAAILRYINLGEPNSKVFDEVYYANEGQQLLDHSVEWRTATDSAGHVTGSYADFVVHPPLGKWIIAAGIKLFEGTSAVTPAFAWRFTAALCGSLAVLIFTLTARRLFRSTMLGAAAGLLMALDGMEFVLSRTAILDIFLMFFIVVAFGCLVMDRDDRRRRWLKELENGLDPSQPGRAGRPAISWRSVPWWRLATGVSLGAACGVKWSGVWYIPLFVILFFAFGVELRKIVGVRRPWRDTLLDDSGWLFALVGLAGITYFSTWTGWFLTDDGWKRHYLANELGQHEYPIIGALQNLYYYHREMLNFHDNLSSPHPYQSWPWQWVILGRPVAFYYQNDPVCGTNNCAAEILLLGTPVLWWAFIPAIIGSIWFGISRRDRRAWIILLGAAAGILPWVPYEFDRRTMFYFYALPAEPFLILAVVFVLGCLITAPAVAHTGRAVLLRFSVSREERRLYGTIFAAAFVVLVALCFWWYYPLYVGSSIPYDSWLQHMIMGNRWV